MWFIIEMFIFLSLEYTCPTMITIRLLSIFFSDWGQLGLVRNVESQKELPVVNGTNAINFRQLRLRKIEKEGLLNLATF